MSYNIRLIDKDKFDCSMCLFDANLWIKILKPQFQQSEYELQYLAFFEKFKNNLKSPKVVLTAMVISEVVNRLIREYGLNKYWQDFPAEKLSFNSLSDIDKKKYFKSHYRKTEHYRNTCISLFEDFSDYEHLCICQNDEFGNLITFNEAMTITDNKLDFNDQYYVYLAKKKNIPIVTDDADFVVEGITVYTYNKKMVNKAKNLVVPNVGKVTPFGTLLSTAINNIDKNSG